MLALMLALAGCTTPLEAQRAEDPLANTRLIRPKDAARARGEVVEGGQPVPMQGAVVQMPPGMWRAATARCAQQGAGSMEALMGCLCSDALWQSAALPPQVLFVMEWPLGPVGMTEAGPVALGPIFRLAVSAQGVEACGPDAPDGQPLSPYAP